MILQAVSPSINFPRQSVTDAGDVVRPFTLRGLSPDHTLVLVNGWRRHQTALVNNFTYGMGAGSSGVDLNALPASALDRVEVLRDGAAAQYGSDAIAGVVNLVLKDGVFSPFVNGDVGRYTPDDYEDDGTTVNVNGGWGIPLGRGSLGCSGSSGTGRPTNRAFADPFEDAGTGVVDSIDSNGQVVQKRNPVDQPNHHWGDGPAKDVLTFANLRIPVNDGGHERAVRLRRVQPPQRQGQRVPPLRGRLRQLHSDRNWTEIYPLGFLPTIDGDAPPTTRRPAVCAAWCRAGTTRSAPSSGTTTSSYNITNTLNASLGPCLSLPCAVLRPGPTASSARRRSRHPESDRVLRRPGAARGVPERRQHREAGESRPARPVNLAFGAAFRRERYAIRQGELACYINGFHLARTARVARHGLSGVRRLHAERRDGSAPDQLRALRRRRDRSHAAGAGRRRRTVRDLQRLRRADARARRRSGTSRRAGSPCARPSSTGFRAPGLSQEFFSKSMTNVIAGQAVDIGIFPVDNPGRAGAGLEAAARKRRRSTSAAASR